MNPGSRRAPRTSCSEWAARSLPRAAILPPAMPTSVRRQPAAVSTRPPCRTVSNCCSVVSSEVPAERATSDAIVASRKRVAGADCALAAASHTGDESGSLGAASQVQLAEDLTHVGLHRVHAEPGAGRDLTVGLSGGDEHQNLLLLVGQHAQRIELGFRGGTCSRPFFWCFDNAPTVNDGAYSLDEQCGIQLLQQV